MINNRLADTIAVFAAVNWWESSLCGLYPEDAQPDTRRFRRALAMAIAEEVDSGREAQLDVVGGMATGVLEQALLRADLRPALPVWPDDVEMVVSDWLVTAFVAGRDTTIWEGGTWSTE
jgi:hypothetical protein